MARVVVKPGLKGPLARLRKLNAALSWVSKRIPPFPPDYFKNYKAFQKDKVFKAQQKERFQAHKIVAGLMSIIEEQNAIVKALQSKLGVTVAQKEAGDD